MRKKIVALGLAVAMLAVAVIGGTLAYFTDTDSADNTFTVGNVQIALNEQQRDADGTALEPFAQNKVLMPIVGSAQGDSVTVGGVAGLPTAKNYVDKIITVKNTGASTAYVRVFVAIPVVLDNVGNASQNILHFNWSGASTASGQWSDEDCTAENAKINGVDCNVYCRTYNTAVAPKIGVTDTPAYIGFYLDKGVDMNADGEYTINGTVINYDFTNGVTIPVFAQAIQSQGFATAAAAFAASGLPTNPWA